MPLVLEGTDFLENMGREQDASLEEEYAGHQCSRLLLAQLEKHFAEQAHFAEAPLEGLAPRNC